MTTKSSRNYSGRTLKILWGRAAGRCAVPTCRIELLAEATEYDPIVTIGDIAHIEASSDAGPRANTVKAKKERDEYDNLILLCLNCHRRLDGQKYSNSVEYIKKLRTDHEAWVRNSLPERGKSTTGWSVILLQGAHPFDLEPAVSALIPDFPSGTPLVIKADLAQEPWSVIQARLEKDVSCLLTAGDPFDFRLAVFPLAPVSACVALGYYLTDRPRARLFKYYADVHSWAWPDNELGPQEAQTISVTGLPEGIVDATGDLALCFHLSAAITDQALVDTGHSFLGRVDVTVPLPSTGWLCRQDQLRELAKVARHIFEASQSRFPNAHGWHLFFAGPAPGAVAVGQQLNPTMCPPVHLYEYRRQQTPSYQQSIILGESHE